MDQRSNWRRQLAVETRATRIALAVFVAGLGIFAVALLSR